MKRSDYLDTGALNTDLKGRSIRGGAATLLEQAMVMVLRVASIAVLGRLLTPEDYGMIAMVAAVTNSVVIFQNVSFSMATVQRAEISDSQVSNLFWINVVIGAALTGAVAGLAPVLVWFYEEPRLLWITPAMGTVFLLTGLTIQHQALLRRQMHFGTLAVLGSGSFGLSVAVAIVAAALGAGYWSLVLLQTTSAAFLAIGAWVACSWRPNWPVRGSGVRPLISFGLDVTMFNLIGYFSSNLDKILLGRFYGSGVLGLYSRAFQILALPMTQIRGPLLAVAMPALSRLQKEPSRYRTYYRKVVLIVAFLSMPLMAFTAVCSGSIIWLLLGDQWTGATDIFRIMAITAFIHTASSTYAAVLLSLAKTRRYLKWGAISAVFTVLALVVGLPWGATGVALSYAILNYLILLPALRYCFRGTPVTVGVFLQAISRPLVASLGMASLVLLCYSWLSDQTHVVSLAVCFIVAIPTYLSVFALMPGGVKILREFRSYAGELAQKS